MSLEQIKPGARVEIALKMNNANKTHVSKVDEIIDDETILIYMPISYGTFVKLPLNKEFNLRFHNNVGIFSGKFEVISYLKKDSADMLLLKQKTPLSKMQRREFFRHDCILPFKFSSVAGNEIENVSVKDAAYVNSKYEDGIVKDISGGGIRFCTNANLEILNIIQCIIPLKDTYTVTLAKVLHADQLSDGVHAYEYRVQFVAISKYDQEMIIQYIFDEQRKILRRQKFETRVE